MLYYEFNVTLQVPVIIDSMTEESKKEYIDNIRSVAEAVNEKQDYNVHIFICDVKDNRMVLAAMIGYKNVRDPEEIAASYVRELGFDPGEIICEEITTSDLRSLIKKGTRTGFVDDMEEIELLFNLPSEPRRKLRGPKEFIADKGLEMQELLEQCSKICMGKELSEEIIRIFEKKNDAFIGHPVHYALVSDDMNEVNTVVGILVSALNSAGRLRSRRVVTLRTGKRFGMKVAERPTLDMDEVSSYYGSIPGGTIVLVPEALNYESETADPVVCDADELASVITEHRRDCLTVLVFGKNNIKSLEKLKTLLGNMRVIEIKETPVEGEAAKNILSQKALEGKVVETASLLSLIDNDGGKTYYSDDLEKLYNEWLDNHLCTEFFTQYKEIEASGKSVAPVRGDAYRELNSLIGLERAKSVVRQALDFNKFRTKYRNSLKATDNPSRHMVFTGNPGTAKTTVARLFAQIMKDNQVLSRGDLIEVGRKDLVGKYVGWTARQVEDIFDRAKGSVLFIDEAYSLCDDRGGSYGDEAINTIVQMMENRRDDTIVIFAGYPDKMKGFLERNPGLRSRIAFHVDFDDYSEDELMGILKLIASNAGKTLDREVETKVRSIIRHALPLKDFGNGRFVRNLFERASMAQASRIMGMQDNEVDENIVNTLTADDFEIPDEIRPKYIFRPIGFAG